MPLRDIVSSSAVSTVPPAVLVPVESIRAFLQKHDVPLEPAAGNPGLCKGIRDARDLCPEVEGVRRPVSRIWKSPLRRH